MHHEVQAMKSSVAQKRFEKYQSGTVICRPLTLECPLSCKDIGVEEGQGMKRPKEDKCQLLNLLEVHDPWNVGPYRL